MQFDIRRFDIYRKIPKDLTQPTFAGAFISVFSCLFIVYLFVAELAAFLNPEITTELFVADPVSHDERISVRLDISLPNMECSYIGLDIQDDTGRHEVGFVENVERIPLINNNNVNGCRFKAQFKVNKVPGNFHVSTHAAREQPTAPDMTHFIHEVTFGEKVDVENLPGSFNPLRNKDKLKSNALATHDYFMKVVPTKYVDTNGNVFYPHQYTYATKEYLQYGHGHRVTPAIWFRYDLTPITVSYQARRKPIYHFLTTVCAIIGGTFTVAGIVDSMFFTATEIFKKAELGKLS